MQFAWHDRRQKLTVGSVFILPVVGPLGTLTAAISCSVGLSARCDGVLPLQLLDFVCQVPRYQRVVLQLLTVRE